MMMRAAITLWLLLLACFLGVTFYYVAFHHVSPLSRDQWHMLHALYERGLWETSITTVSGHRHILAFILYDMDMRFFSGKNHFLVAVDWLLNAGLIALLCRQVCSDVADRTMRFWLLGWTVALLTWLLNIALLGWGFNGINNYMSIVNCVLSVFFLHKSVHETHKKYFNVLVALLLAGLSTLSFGNGVLVWPIWLLSLYLWRAAARFFAIAIAGCFVFVGAYLLLPGREAVGQSLFLPSVSVLRFPAELMGGPLYHLLRAWRVVPEGLLSIVPTLFGIVICITTAVLLQRLLLNRPSCNRLQALAVALICIGAGTTIMLTLTRVEGVLDPATDRFQIWALLVWLGLSLLLCNGASLFQRRIWCTVFAVFPLLAFPAQLDWGARLAEYRTRVDNSLLSFQVYLPVAGDAEKALHWNWENKLQHLFPMLEILRARHLNVFAGGQADWLNRKMPDTRLLRACVMTVQQQENIAAEDLLVVDGVASAENYRVRFSRAEEPVGMRWVVRVDEPLWDYGVIASVDGTVRGLMQPVHHSRLPRFSGLVNERYNAYAVARTDGDSAEGVHELLLFAADQPVCRYRL